MHASAVSPTINGTLNPVLNPGSNPAGDPALNPPRPRCVTEPAAVDPMVSAGSGSKLPETVIVDCRWHESCFHGWSAPPLKHRRFRVRGAAVRGGLHAASGTEGQDVVGAAWDTETGTLFVAVADGIGSLPRSGAVAQEAVTAVLHLCMTRPDTLDSERAGSRLFGAVADGLKRSFRGRTTGGTTLVVAQVRPTTTGAHITVHGIGDSEAWVHSGGKWLALHNVRTQATEGTNVTQGLPADRRQLTKTFQIAGSGVLVLTTDGFADRFASQPHRQQLGTHWRWAPKPADFFRTVAAGDDDYSDDRGVVGVWID